VNAFTGAEYDPEGETNEFAAPDSVAPPVRTGSSSGGAEVAGAAGRPAANGPVAGDSSAGDDWTARAEVEEAGTDEDEPGESAAEEAAGWSVVARW
jgi:hypothetical protein